MTIRVGILGPLDVRDSAGRVIEVRGARLRSLLIRLLIAGGQAVAVDTLAADLWPADSPPADAGNAVQALVFRLRVALGKDAVEYGPAGYRLAIAPGAADTAAFEEQVAAARALAQAGDHARAAQAFGDALGLWRGEALADVADAPFAAPVIARLDGLRLSAIQDRIDADLALGRGAQIVPEIEQLTSEQPLQERLRGQQMRALVQAGRQADALGVFEQTRRLLADELGVDPSPALAAVHLAILRGELPAPAPAAEPALPARPVPARTGNLPAQLTSFVGRDDELDRVTAVLRESRLVTLTGPGGAGKTRLSVEAGARLGDRAPDGVWFVPLSPVRDAIDVPQAVLTAVGGRDVAWHGDPAEAARLAALEPLQRLSEVLAARTLVLVLDNCEHVLDAVASLAGNVLASAPGVRILATSREPLGLTGETLCPVPSLALPPADAAAQTAAASPAVRLFADRAGAVRPGFAIDEESAGPVVRICRALDGIPLAIELAAARVRALTPGQVADRLDDRFALLSTGTRGALPRHQTLRAIVDWSWELLDETERTVLAQLSVFAGGATPASAEQVCSAGGQAGVVDVIASLVDKSLVTATGDHEVRYRLLETVRAYAAERLAEAGQTGELAARHAAYFLALAERAEPELRRRGQLAWLDRLTAEHDNFSAALRHLISAGEAAPTLRLTRALFWFWLLRDYDAEAAEWAVEVVQLTGDTAPEGLAEAHLACRLVAALGTAAADSPGAAAGPAQLRATLRELDLPAQPADPLVALVVPMMTLLLGDRGRADELLESLASHPDPWVRATRRALTGHLALSDGDIAAAKTELAGARGMFTAQGDRFGLILAMRGLAEVAVCQGRPADAVQILEQARAHAAGGVAANMAETLRIPLGRARAEAGDTAAARAELEDSIANVEKIGESDDAAWGYITLSEIARRDGDLNAACDLLEQAREAARSTARPDMSGAVSAACSKLGCIAEQRGDLDCAAQWHQRALAALNQPDVVSLPSNQHLAPVVEGVAALRAAQGDCERAAELLTLASQLQGYANERSLEVRRARAAIQAKLSGAQIEAASDRGRRLNRDDALALNPAL